MFVLVVALVLLLVAAAAAGLVWQAQRAHEDKARERAVAIAETFAQSPETVAALHSSHPTASLQPRVENLTHRTGVTYVVVSSLKGIRLAHSNPHLVGRGFLGPIEPALAGRISTQTISGPSGENIRAVVPVTDARGSVVGVVGVGVPVQEVTRHVQHQLPVLLGAAAGALALAIGGVVLVGGRLRRQTRGLGPVEITRMYEHHDAVLRSVREGVVITGGDGRVVLANDEARRLLDLPEDVQGRHVTELGFDPRTAELLASGRVANDEVHRAGDRLLAVNQRPAQARGRPWGSVATLRDTTELRALTGKVAVARQRLKLVYDAGLGIGTTLDVRKTAEELAHVAVPQFADFVTVDLPDSVLRGDEPDGAEYLRRTAVGAIRDDHPLYPVSTLISCAPSRTQVRGFRTGESALVPNLSDSAGWVIDPDEARKILDYGIHSLIAVPLCARGVILGMVDFWRQEKPEPFEDDDLFLAQELVNRAAVCIDNARRFTREHAMAVALQRSLLPRGLPEQSAVEVAYRYLPAQAGVGGDWFDVIPLSGARVALVVGDVVGHGFHAAATMGRLRTAVHTFSTLDLPPDELLARLDELADRIDRESTDQDITGPIAGATCLYAIYDSVTRRCSMARAGHPPPALVLPDGTVEFPELPAGPPLGVGGLPFEHSELELPEGSKLVLYTNGLIENRDRDINSGLDTLKSALSHAGTELEETCGAVLDALLPPRPSDDIVLLVARTRTLPPNQVAHWEVPRDPAAVRHIRSAVANQLGQWDLDATAFVTELILSELITNAIRHATGPIGVRLLLDGKLTCEVSDGSSTSPHLRYAATTDEGGRGLYLVAQFADRWGTRYTADGKVIWAEQLLEPTSAWSPSGSEVPRGTSP
nr:SpoIIE family protein phosphatase [Streptomyces sp. NBC_00830]